MNVNGIDVDALTPSISDSFPGVVPGRELQLDGDVVVYNCSYDDTKTLQDCLESYIDNVEYRRKMSGSETAVVHLTGSNKGGRFDIAKVKEYQVDRNKNKIVYKNLQPLRELLISGTYTFKVILHEDQEADDGMAQGNFKAITEGDRDKSIIMSIDKDLTMCSGLHCDWSSFKITDVDGYGSIYLDTSGSTKKIKGFGTSFFFAQLLTGDGADSIPGLPKLGASLLNVYAPTKKSIEDTAIVEAYDPTCKKAIAAQKRLDNRKPKSVGPVLAYEILKDITNDSDALHRVRECYLSYYGEGTFTSSTWNGYDIEVTSAKMLLEQARLLWMRRVPDEDVTKFFKDVIDGIKWDKENVNATT